MKKEIAEKWVAALRSGEYKQHRGGLANRKRTKHCCLGVLCETAIKEGVEMLVEVRSEMPNDMYFEDATGALPYSVQKWAGMKSSHGLLNDSLALTSINDELRKDFGFIADTIELRWEEL